MGFSLGLREVNPFRLALFIGFFSMVFTFIGLKMGKYLKATFGKFVQILAGILLILLGMMNYFEWPF